MRRSMLNALATAVALGLGFVNVAMAAPTAIIGATPNPALPGQTISFDGSASFDPTGAVLGPFEWDWDDDGVSDYSGVSAFHSFALEGIYPVTLRVWNDAGLSDSDTIDIRVQANGSGVPEPTTLALLGLGLAGLAASRRRRR